MRETNALLVRPDLARREKVHNVPRWYNSSLASFPVLPTPDFISSWPRDKLSWGGKDWNPGTSLVQQHLTAVHLLLRLPRRGPNPVHIIMFKCMKMLLRALLGSYKRNYMYKFRA